MHKENMPINDNHQIQENQGRKGMGAGRRTRGISPVAVNLFLKLGRGHMSVC